MTLADCPNGSCLTYVFAIPAAFKSEPYANVGKPLVQCFPDEAPWNRALSLTPNETACPQPDPPKGFCAQR